MNSLQHSVKTDQLDFFTSNSCFGSREELNRNHSTVQAHLPRITCTSRALVNFIWASITQHLFGCGAFFELMWIKKKICRTHCTIFYSNFWFSNVIFTNGTTAGQVIEMWLWTWTKPSTLLLLCKLGGIITSHHQYFMLDCSRKGTWMFQLIYCDTPFINLNSENKRHLTFPSVLTVSILVSLAGRSVCDWNI